MKYKFKIIEGTIKHLKEVLPEMERASAGNNFKKGIELLENFLKHPEKHLVRFEIADQLEKLGLNYSASDLRSLNLKEN